MTLLNDAPMNELHAAPGLGARALYEALLTPAADPLVRSRAREFLGAQLAAAEQLPCALPASPGALLDWVRDEARQTTEHYAEYLQRRRDGGPREYFSCPAHALYFLRGVAPTKLVDGAWLYGLLPHWQDPRQLPLIRTYLEELGSGDARFNHVLLYRRLLAENACDDLDPLSDEHFLQGAVQLAFAQLADDFLPELIGYNLGYEQLPLHLLISNYELQELGLDAFYFQLHVTIDNADSGHARRAVHAVLDNLPSGDHASYLARVANGYRLNDLGLGSRQVIADFDLEAELLRLLERKRQVAGQVHSDRCRIAGRTVNQWLQGAEGIAGFLAALQDEGWIQRHRDPRHSRFWRLIEGDRPAMFGVFDHYERQVLYDWIAGGWPPPRAARPRPTTLGAAPADAESEALHQQLAQLSAEQRATRLIELMAPATHATPAGLLATRRFAEEFVRS